MGSEGKSRKRRASPSSSEDEDGKRRKHRKRDDGERKSRKDKKEKKNSERSHKHSRNREGKEKKLKEKHKRSRKNLDADFEQLSKDDYYSKNNEFATWLKEEKGIFFSDLSSEAARDLFSSFIKYWNSQKLPSQYYEGITSAPRTAHNWRIRQEK